MEKLVFADEEPEETDEDDDEASISLKKSAPIGEFDLWDVASEVKREEDEMEEKEVRRGGGTDVSSGRD
ncbi:hypothetical protein FOA43_002352 [Brettanomyces nanus]|uniref:Uncharacterized protein n=1 Tax=Eeniella nana TaxID=13502 RepID=A0A875S4M2_EENNA|nr:uncharacterized protein FOA43_002352 [Brettanomyces nanus]QPG75012.1 hypothetical protein FOA43_002352 [Brettanomyces nanus]